MPVMLIGHGSNLWAVPLLLTLAALVSGYASAVLASKNSSYQHGLRIAKWNAGW